MRDWTNSTDEDEDEEEETVETTAPVDVTYTADKATAEVVPERGAAAYNGNAERYKDA